MRWSGIVTAASTRPNTTSADRHPRRSARIAVTGWKIVLANPATSVRVVIARVALAPNCLTSTTCAGSYRTSAIAAPMATQVT